MQYSMNFNSISVWPRQSTTCLILSLSPLQTLLQNRLLLGTREVWHQPGYTLCDQQAPLHMANLSGQYTKEGRRGYILYKNKEHSSSPSHKKGHNHPYVRLKKSQNSKSITPAWKTIGSHGHVKKRQVKQLLIPNSQGPVVL